MTPLHTKVEQLAQDKPALVISVEAFRGFLLNNFRDKLTRLRNISVPLDGFPAIEVRFTEISVGPNQFDITLATSGGEIFAYITPAFTVTLAVHVAGNTALEFSRIELAVTNTKVKLSVNPPTLVLGQPDFDVTGTVRFSASRVAALAHPEVNEVDVLRVEGAVGYVMPRTVIGTALSAISSLDLSRHFTAFETKGEWGLHQFREGLVILPADGAVIKENLGCPLKDSAPSLTISTGPRSDLRGGNYQWPVNVGGVAPAIPRPANDRLDGFASVYVPKPVWEKRFGMTMPAIVYRESDNGFIGYDLSFLFALSYLGLRMDPARFGIAVDFSIAASGYAFLTVDVPCVGRSDLAYARFSVGPSNVSILLSFALSPPGKLVLESRIDSLSVGAVKVNFSGFSRWLGLAGGKAAVVGFVLDHICKRVVEHYVPIKLREAIKQELNSKNFPLLDLESLAGYTRYGVFNEATYSGNAQSVLVGLLSDG